MGDLGSLCYRIELQVSMATWSQILLYLLDIQVAIGA